MMETVQNLRAAAERFIARFGNEAPQEAHLRAVELAKAGHETVAAEWEAIAALAEDMLSHLQGNGDTVH